MKKLNKKGFTLTEILATLIILGVIIAIAIPSYNNLSEKFEKEYYDKLEDTVLEAAKTYYKDNQDERPVDLLESSVIDFEKLIDDKYIDSINKYRSEESMEGYVTIIKHPNNYLYTFCTDENQTPNKYCDKAWENNNNITKCEPGNNNSCEELPAVWLYYDKTWSATTTAREKLREILSFSETYTKTLENEYDGSIYYTITVDGEEFYPINISEINKSKKTETPIKVNYSNDSSRDVHIYQYPAPEVETEGVNQVTLSTTEDFGINFADDNEEGESSFDCFQQSINDGEWVSITISECDGKTCPISYPEMLDDGNYKIKYRYIDNFGNISAETQEYQIEVSTTKNTLSVVATTEDGENYTSGKWTNQNVIFSAKATLKDGYKLVYTNDGSTKDFSPNSNGEYILERKVDSNKSYVGTYKFKIVDSTGTIASDVSEKVIDVKIDKIPPQLSYTILNSSGTEYNGEWTKNDLLLTVNASDAHSGLNTVKYKTGLISWRLPSEEEGIYAETLDSSIDSKIEITATDNVTNETKVETDKVRIDKDEPWCVLTKSLFHDDRVLLTSVDSDSGIAKKEVKMGNVTLSNVFLTNYYKFTKSGTITATVTDNVGYTGQCKISVTVETDEPTQPDETITLSPPKISLSSTSQTTKDVTFTITNPNDKGTIYYSFDKVNWAKYTSGRITLINYTGTRTVYAKVQYDGVNSSISSATGKCNKDVATHGRQTNGKNSTGCWFQLWMEHNSDYTGNKGVTLNRFQYAYWGAESTTHTTNQYWGTTSYNSKLKEKCGTAPPSGVKIFDTGTSPKKNSQGQTLTNYLYQKYSSQYYCFAIREYRPSEISGINRWKVWYKNVSTTNTCPTSGYTSQIYGG